jgi:hypothetical protein
MSNIDLAEFTEEIIRICKREGKTWTNRSIAEEYLERLDEVPLDEDEYEVLLDDTEQQIAYYTGVGI